MLMFKQTDRFQNAVNESREVEEVSKNASKHVRDYPFYSTDFKFFKRLKLEQI